MKINTSPLKLLQIFSFALAGIIIFSSCSKDNDDVDYTISGNAHGNKMVPSVQVNGTGTISGNYNTTTNVLNYTSSWINLTGSPVMGGFYSGSASHNGIAIGSGWNFGITPGGSGTASGSIKLTDEQETNLLNGNMYYMIGTNANPNGEIRSQISLTE